MDDFTSSDRARFLAKVGLPDADGCMPWLAGLDHYGYGQISCRRDGKQRVLKAHRVMHTLFIGPLTPGLDIDHICGNRWCVAPGHLRAATRKQNMENLGGAYRTSKSGVRGVSWDRRLGKWVARVGHNKTYLYLGLYDDIDEAALVVARKRDELFTHNDRDRMGAM